ncbi:MAG: 5-formyltetrahydrofolate cyclo-ligase, partial [Actinomyces ruminicola]|nr:5-formyltetrahydrofolate cyclo-ligase [Actinomyces ruminicola]
MSTQARVLPDTGSLAVGDAKEQLRQVLRQHRAAHHRHPEHGHNATCRRLTAHILQAIAGMDTVAAYVSVGHEPCTRLLLEHLEESGTAVLLP